jgi:hypothetical protein
MQNHGRKQKEICTPLSKETQEIDHAALVVVFAFCFVAFFVIVGVVSVVFCVVVFTSALLMFVGVLFVASLRLFGVHCMRVQYRKMLNLANFAAPSSSASATSSTLRIAAGAQSSVEVCGTPSDYQMQTLQTH